MPAGPSHGEIIGKMNPFLIEEQKVVPKTKMLIVVDNSGSMKNSQANLAKGLDSIFASLEDQISNGLNPEIEFYIVTTTVPEVLGSVSLLRKSNDSESLTLASAEYTSLKQFDLVTQETPLKVKSYSINELKEMLNNGEILAQPLLPYSAIQESLDVSYSVANWMVMAPSNFYKAYQSYLGFNPTRFHSLPQELARLHL